MVHIQYRTHTQDADFAGHTVGEVRNAFENAFAIPREAIPQVNGDQATDDQVLQDADKVTFVHSGKKATP
jgi:hypothetical protein